jgi:hypothetical protein
MLMPFFHNMQYANSIYAKKLKIVLELQVLKELLWRENHVLNPGESYAGCIFNVEHQNLLRLAFKSFYSVSTGQSDTPSYCAGPQNSDIGPATWNT